MFQRAIQSESFSPMSLDDNHHQGQPPGGENVGYGYPKNSRADVESAIGFGSSMMGRPVEDDLRPEDAADAVSKYELQSVCGRKPCNCVLMEVIALL